MKRGPPGKARPSGSAQAGSERRAGVAELADALDLGSSDLGRGGSNPPARTTPETDQQCGLPIIAAPYQRTAEQDADHRDQRRRPEARVYRHRRLERYREEDAGSADRDRPNH